MQMPIAMRASARAQATLLTAILLCSAEIPAAAAVRVDAPAPAFRIDAVDGGKIEFARFHGRPVMLNFFATWCPPCKLELPYIVRQYPAYARRVVFLGIDEQESPGAVTAF